MSAPTVTGYVVWDATGQRVPAQRTVSRGKAEARARRWGRLRPRRDYRVALVIADVIFDLGGHS